MLLLLIFILFRKAKRAMVPNSMEAFFQKGESYGERERERKREREIEGGREGDDKQFCSVKKAILQRQ